MASQATEETATGPWYRGATKNQWRAFAGAYMGWMLDVMDLIIFSFVITYVIAEFDADAGVAGLVASATLIASAFGGIVFGFIADRIGRTKSMMLSILCYSIGTLLCGFAPNLQMLFVFRIIVGLGVGGEWGAGAALVSETWPARHRGKVMAWVQSAFATGYALAAIVAAIAIPLGGWRWAFFVGVIPAVLAFWVRHNTEEPQIWKDSKRVSAKGAVKKLFAEHPKAVLACLGFTAAASCGYWGLFTWIPSYLATPVAEGGQGLDLLKSTTWIVIMQVGAAAGFISFGYISDRIGRRKTFMSFFAAAAIMVPVFMFIQGDVAIIIFGAIMAFVGTGFYSGFGPTFAELFPTEIRAFAQGFIYNTGRAISAAAPAMVGFLSIAYGPTWALASTAGFYLLAAVLVFFFLPETKGKMLESDSVKTEAVATA
ncbi:MFS transporter [Salinibacterium sp. dk2585]|uniref:MFS transporter n=1 Tax=unclassified Salinibacterium TaxID=2632331 RepID=UPI0011C25114|nr:MULTISPECIES: MFS transporter [unclassified Salinibacterium]QEE60245.1 MFS transporter [Salinibacterium sp. dk2585]TXK55317.1 MFS transporter [Salinibacterium sp. dk5596]